MEGTEIRDQRAGRWEAGILEWRSYGVMQKQEHTPKESFGQSYRHTVIPEAVLWITIPVAARDLEDGEMEVWNVGVIHNHEHTFIQSYSEAVIDLEDGMYRGHPLSGNRFNSRRKRSRIQLPVIYIL